MRIIGKDIIYNFQFEHTLTCVLKDSPIFLGKKLIITRMPRNSSHFFGKNLIIYINYNLELVHFSITKGVMENYFTYKRIIQITLLVVFFFGIIFLLN